MKRTFCIGFAGLMLLSGCISKKKTTHGSRQSDKEARAEKYDKAGNNPDEFVYFAVDSPEEYIETFAEVAMFEMKSYGIPASVTLAQGLLESGFGRGELTRKTNNHFGIKCGP